MFIDCSFLRLVEGVAYVCISAYRGQIGILNVNIMLVDIRSRVPAFVKL